MPETKKWLTRRQAADLLGVSVRQIDAYADAGRLPRYYLPTPRTSAAKTPRPAPRFRIEDVHALVEGPSR